jgi:hypothetical protein
VPALGLSSVSFIGVEGMDEKFLICGPFRKDSTGNFPLVENCVSSQRPEQLLFSVKSSRALSVLELELLEKDPDEYYLKC